MSKKPIELTFRIGFANLKDEVDIKVWCRDSYAITWMSNSKVLQDLVKAEKSNGGVIALGYDKDGKLIAIQKYEDMNSKEIARKITKELNAASGGALNIK